VTAITLTMPVCPSTNMLFRNEKRVRRFKTREYRAWIEEAGYALNRYVLTPIHGEVHVSICIPEKTPGDIDNRIKAALDLIVSRGWIDDDRHIKSLHVIRDTGSDMRVDVRAA
jgi:Holliday junction resolvase RusA-like endonuclease